MKKLLLLAAICALSVSCASVQTITTVAQTQASINQCSQHPAPCLSAAQYQDVSTVIQQLVVVENEVLALQAQHKATPKDYLRLAIAADDALQRIMAQGEPAATIFKPLKKISDWAHKRIT
jgi:hypothetical protein